MSVNADIPPLPKPGPITSGYTHDSSDPKHRWRRRLLVTATLLFCIFYGMAFALFAPYLLLVFAIPLVVLAALVIWALPDSRRAPIGFLQFMFFAYIIAVVIWPNYIGFALPGLPWFTLARLTGLPVTLLFLLCYSTSKPFRDQIADSLGAAPLIWKLLLLFVLLEIFSIVISKDKSLSINHFVNAQAYWTIMFFASAYIFSKPGTLDRFLKILWAMAIIVGLIGVWEKHLRHVPWLGHIPHLLQIQDPVVLLYLAGQGRYGSTEYRVQGTFLHPLALGEYVALVMPFVLQYAISNGKPALRIAAVVSAFFMVYIALISGSRSSLIGCVAALGLFLLLWSASRWRTKPRDLIGPAVVLTYPVIFVMFITASFAVGRLRNKIWGGGAAQASTQGRMAQWAKAIPMIEKNPIGHGIGMAAQTLNYQAPNGLVTIDSYYLSVALEYGIIGLFVYYGMFLFAVYEALKVAFSRMNFAVKDRELLMLAPTAMMIVNFIILKAVYSEEYNHCFAFIALGIVCALIWRIKENYRATAPETEATASDSPAGNRVRTPPRPAPKRRWLGTPSQTPGV